MPELRDFASEETQEQFTTEHEGVVRKIIGDHTVVMQVDASGTKKKLSLSGGVLAYALAAADLPVNYSVVGETIVHLSQIAISPAGNMETHPTVAAERAISERQAKRNARLALKDRNATLGTVYTSRYDHIKPSR